VRNKAFCAIPFRENFVPTVSVSSLTTNASNTADIAAGGAYFNNELNIAFIITVVVLVVAVAYQWIVQRGVKGAVKAIGVRTGGRRGRGRRR